MNQKDWEAAGGEICPSCGKEVVRILDGMCLQCWERKNAEEVRAMEYMEMALTYDPRKRRG